MSTRREGSVDSRARAYILLVRLSSDISAKKTNPTKKASLLLSKENVVPRRKGEI